MQRFILPATILLIVQLGLVVGVYTQDQGFEPYAPNSKVVDFEPSAADTIYIAGEDGNLELKKLEDSWVLSIESKVPANNQQVETFLDTISGLKRTLAVATTENAAKRFKVSDNEYNYHLVIKDKEAELANLYFGTSPGFKQIHMRPAGTNEIIIGGLSSHELSPKVEQWIDKDLLKLAKDSIKKIEMNNYVFARNEDSIWEIEKADGEPDLETEKIEDLLDKMINLSVSGFITDNDKKTNSAILNLSFSLTLAEDKKLDWKFEQIDDTEFVVYRSDLSFGVKVSKWQVDDLQKVIGENRVAADEKLVEDVPKE